MRIVILDGQIINPGDISWAGFEALGEVIVYPQTSPQEVLQRCQGADVLITNKTRLPEDIIAKLPDLKYIGIVATGYDVVDIVAAAKHGVPVCNVVAYGVGTVAQHVMALTLELCRQSTAHSQSVKDGEWKKRGEWCYWLNPIRDLGDMKMGIVGFGNIGQEVGRMAHALGMQVQAYNRSPKTCDAYPCDFVELDTLFTTSDVISLHCPLHDGTRHMINAKRLVGMKKGALLINTARGPLLHEQDVADALHSGQLGGVGLDVLSTEPPDADNPLLTAPNTIITPHIAWATRKARENILRLAVENLAAWQAGKAQNVVNAKEF